jgi:hypothetical protein
MAALAHSRRSVISPMKPTSPMTRARAARANRREYQRGSLLEEPEESGPGVMEWRVKSETDEGEDNEETARARGELGGGEEEEVRAAAGLALVKRGASCFGWG